MRSPAPGWRSRTGGLKLKRSLTPLAALRQRCPRRSRVLEQSLKTHLSYPLQHFRPAHSPPPFRAVLKPDRSRATKTGQITSQLQERADGFAGRGRIVYISSVSGLGPTGSSIAYAVSKAGLIHLTGC